MVLRPQTGLSLCAGGGGLDLGLMLAEPGFHTRCFVEWEEYPQQAIIAAQRAGYFKPAPIWTDLRTFDGRPWRGYIDTILAGYPCQPVSSAGKRKGMDDDRWLWPDVARIIREVQPRWVFLENVRGHVSLGAETVLRELWDMGWTPSAGLFSAQETGATHERQRWFCVAQCQGDDGWGQQQPGGSGGRGAGFAGNCPELANPNGTISGADIGEPNAGPNGWHDTCGRGTAALDDARHTEWRSIDAQGHDLYGAATKRNESTSRSGKSGETFVGDARPVSDTGRLDTQADRTGPIAGNGKGSEREWLWSRSRGASNGLLGHTAGLRRGKGQPKSILWGWWATTAIASGTMADARCGRSCEGPAIGHQTEQAKIRKGRRGWAEFGHDSGSLADTSGARSQGGEQRSTLDQRNRPPAPGSIAQRCRPLLQPPGPNDNTGWAHVLSHSPELAPDLGRAGVLEAAKVYFAAMDATPQRAEQAPGFIPPDHIIQTMAGQAGLVLESQIESAVCRMADGLANRTRALRLLGNGVHPLAAGYAWRTLSAAHGLLPVDLEAASRSTENRTIEPVLEGA